MFSVEHSVDRVSDPHASVRPMSNTYTVYDHCAVEVPGATRVTARTVEEAVRLLGIFDTGHRIDVDPRADVAEVHHPVTGLLEAQVARVGF